MPFAMYGEFSSAEISAESEIARITLETNHQPSAYSVDDLLFQGIIGCGHFRSPENILWGIQRQ